MPHSAIAKTIRAYFTEESPLLSLLDGVTPLWVHCGRIGGGAIAERLELLRCRCVDLVPATIVGRADPAVATAGAAPKRGPIAAG
jgi:hypothetical protein